MSDQPDCRPDRISTMRSGSTAKASIRFASGCRGGRVLQGEVLASFDRERQRIDRLLGNEAESTQLASN